MELLSRELLNKGAKALLLLGEIFKSLNAFAAKIVIFPFPVLDTLDAFEGGKWGDDLEVVIGFWKWGLGEILGKGRKRLFGQVVG